MRTLFAAAVPLLIACASTPEPNDPGPMRPLAPDVELDAAAPLDIKDIDAMRAWLPARVAAAHDHRRERVRLPVVRRPVEFACDCPEFAVATAPDQAPHYWVHLVDMTSAGIPEGAWVGWVDGRFTGAFRTYPSTDMGGREIIMPVFEVMAQRRRGPDEAPVVRFVAAKK